MCDYSLAGLPNRLAVEGDQLVVHRFSTGAMGLAPLCPSLKQFLFPSSTPAVCVPPGARLRLRDLPGYLQFRLQVGTVEEVTFAGPQDRVTVRLPNYAGSGEDILLQVTVSADKVREGNIRPRQEVWVGLKAYHLLAEA